MALKKFASSTVKKLYNKALQNYSAKLAGNKSFLYNQYVLYASFIVCFINLLIWLFSGEFVHVAVFLLVGYLTSRFSKNMIVILVISLVISNVFKSGSNIVLEGMVGKKDKDSDTKKDKMDETDEKDDKDDKDDTAYNSKNKEGVKNTEKKKQGFTGKKEKMEESEDTDESKEGIDENESPCTSDKDCEKGFKCNDKYVCAAST